MSDLTTNTPGAVSLNRPNKPVQPDNATSIPNTPNALNAPNTAAPYDPDINRPNTPVTPNAPNAPNTPNTPGAYEAPALVSPAVPNRPNAPNQANTPNTPNDSLSQGNVPNSANQPMTPVSPIQPNAPHTPALSQDSAGGNASNLTAPDHVTGSEIGSDGPGTRSGARSEAGNGTLQPFPSGPSRGGSSSETLGIVFLAVLLLTLSGFFLWKRMQKRKKTREDPSTADPDGPETPPTGP